MVEKDASREAADAEAATTDNKTNSEKEELDEQMLNVPITGTTPPARRWKKYSRRSFGNMEFIADPKGIHPPVVKEAAKVL